MVLGKRQVWAIFLFKMCCKAAETTHDINNTSGPRTANEHITTEVVKMFCKGNESLEDEECSGWPLDVDNDQLRATVEADPLTTTREVAEELDTDHSIVIWHLKQTGRVKKLDKWCLMT